jgi:hypothetical protein
VDQLSKVFAAIVKRVPPDCEKHIRRVAAPVTAWPNADAFGYRIRLRPVGNTSYRFFFPVFGSMLR